MQLRLLAVGRKNPVWVQQGYEEYAQRMPRHLPLTLIEIDPATRTKNGSVAQYQEQEAKRVLNQRADGSHLVLLDVAARPWSTEQLAGHLESWMQNAQTVDLVIGGPDGFHDTLKQQAAQRWSLGPMTLPHPMVRMIVAEQLYRAHSILVGHPYHRA